MAHSGNRGQFPRSSVSGRIPRDLSPGSFAVNWTDRKIYVGGPSSEPILFSQHLDDWSQLVAYAQGDFVIHEGELLRATAAVPAGQSFDETQWQRLTDNTSARFAAPSATGVLSGGAIEAVSATSIEVAPGSGVIVDSTAPETIVYTEVSWGGFELAVPITGSPQGLVVTIGPDGAAQIRPETVLDWEERRKAILLGFVGTDETEIVFASSTPLPATDVAETVRDEYQSNGGPYKVSGVQLLPAGSDMALQATAGQFFTWGLRWHFTPYTPNIVAQDARNPLPFEVVMRTGAVVGPPDVIDPDLWDNAGVQDVVPDGQVTIQYVFQRAGDQIVVQPGQALYQSISLALQSIGFDWEAFMPASSPMTWVVLGAVVVVKGATDLSDPAQAFIVGANAGRGFPFPKQFVAPDQDLSAFLRHDGSVPWTGDQDAGGHALLNADIDGGTY